MIDSKPDVSTQRPHASGEHITKPGQTRQTGSHGSAVRKQRLKHLSHPAARADPHRLIRGLPFDPLKVGLDIKRPVIRRGSPGGGPTTAQPQRPGTVPVLNQGNQLLWPGGDQAGTPRISRLRIEENGTV